MNAHYDRKWQIIEDLEFDLFDGNQVSIQWLGRDDDENWTYPDQIRVHTTAYSNPRRMWCFRKLNATRDYGPGWEPVIMAAVEQATEDLRLVKLDTFDDFILRLFVCFQELWRDVPDSPVQLPEDGDEAESDDPESSDSPLNEFYRQESIDAAVSLLRHGVDNMLIEVGDMDEWGESSDASLEVDEENEP
jgi:hypothetical protein